MDISRGLPGLQDIPQGERAASIAGPGDYPILLSEYSSWYGATIDNAQLVLDGSAQSAWSVYRIGEFDDDMLSVSAHVDVAAGTDDFWLGFSDFENGRWNFAGPYSGSSDVDIPLGNDVNHPARFVSGTGSMYLAIVSDGPGSVAVEGIQLQVNGGNLGPQPAGSLYDAGSPDHVDLHWDASPSEDDPDFAGYLLQRAPFGGGNYVDVLSGNPEHNAYQDFDVIALDSYRYRLYAVDSAGNHSVPSYSAMAGTGPGNNRVVAVLECSRGPLYGPVQVDFDLSASYVNGSDPIDTYELLISGLPLQSGSTPQFSVNLQPGCYIISARVKSGALSGRTLRYLQIFPRWQEDSVLVDELQGNFGRLSFAHSVRLPDGRLAHFGYDELLSAAAVWFEDGEGGLQLRLNYLDEIDIDGSCEPLLIDGIAQFALHSPSSGIYLFGFDGENLTRSSQALTSDGPDFSLVLSKAGRPAVFYQIDNGGSKDLVFVEFTNDAVIQPVLSGIAGGLQGLDAVYNPAADAYDICYGDNIALNWERWLPGTGHIAGGGLYNFVVRHLDMELDPQTQRPAMLVDLDVAPKEAWYIRQDAGGIWQLPELIDNGMQSNRIGDLEFGSQECYVLNSMYDGVDDRLRLYARDTGNWTVLHDDVQANAIEDKASLLADAAELQAGLPLKGGVYELRNYQSAGGFSTPYVIEAYQDGYEGELHAASAADGLHVVWLNHSYKELEHASSPDGTVWTNLNDTSGKVTDIDLASNALGELYLSYVDVNSTELHWWNGSNWVSQAGYPGVAGFRPSLMSQPTNELMYWYVHLQPAKSMRFVSVNQLTPIAFANVVVDTPTYLGTVIDGGFSFAGVKPRWYALSGSSLNGATMSFIEYNYSDTQDLAVNQGRNDSRIVWGRTLDSSLFNSRVGARHCVWLTSASGVQDSVAIYPDEFGGNYQTNVFPLPGAFDALLAGAPNRRTVNMSMAGGTTAVIMEAGLFGDEARLIWSNFGNFNELPLPLQLNEHKGAMIGSPEVLVGADGRWHIIYLDLKSNQLRCISTL